MQRSKVFYTNDKTELFEFFVYDVVNILTALPCFGFCLFDTVEQDPDYTIVSYPDLTSDEPLLTGTISLYLKYKTQENNILIDDSVVDPTWKILLNSINDFINKNELPFGQLVELNIIGLANMGMGYSVEALLDDK